MTGSIQAQFIIPIVAVVVLFSWLGLVFWADSHPYWKGQRPPEQQVTGHDVVQGAEPGAPPVQSAATVPGQRGPARDDSPRVEAHAGSATAAPTGRRPRRG
jgi:hypothetical protein